MRYLFRILAPSLIFLLFLPVLPTSGQEKKEKEPWKGKFADGTVITEQDLAKILTEHKKWDKTAGNEGLKANLWRADLTGANLSEANLSRADLSEANLAQADLTNANLGEADLTNANLALANLTNAVLLNANLTNVVLFNADLTNAVLIKADLTNADLGEADLTNANLAKANLTKANLAKADLTNANLGEADLTNADLGEAVFSEKTFLFDADLKDATFWQVKLPSLKFEPRAGSPPYIPAMATAKDLSSLTFETSSHGLVDLREGFKKAGLREQEREITYAIEHTKRMMLTSENPFSSLFLKKEKKGKGKEEPSSKKEHSFIEKLGREIIGWIYYTFVELTCSYGMSPWRPLFLLIFASIPVFTVPYVFCLRKQSKDQENKDGIWKVWSKERVREDLGKTKPKELLALHGWSALKVAFYFSILSAFSIGWRELNVGNWIARIQRYEYNYRATGWARTVSGIQSLLSVYLLALWALTYFGRPFE